MTKKDFIVITKILRNIREEMSVNGYQTIVGAFIAELMKVNPRFDADKFQKSCFQDFTGSNV